LAVNGIGSDRAAQSTDVSKLPPILTSNDLPLTELHALKLDGDLFMIDDAFSPVDHPATITQRARSLAVVCTSRLIAEQRTAAWVWGAVEYPPARLELCASIGARARVSDTGRISLREVVIDDSEVVALGGIRLTTPLRTALDLLRFQPSLDVTLVTRLLRIGNLSIERCAAVLDARNNLPQKKLAAARLRELASHPVDVVDGVNAAHGAQHAIEVGRVAHFEDVAAKSEALARS
jgi:hypothetical protein